MNEQLAEIFSALEQEYEEYQRTINDDSIERSYVEVGLIYDDMLAALPYKVPEYLASKTVSFLFNEMGCKIPLDPHTIKRIIVAMFLVSKE